MIRSARSTKVTGNEETFKGASLFQIKSGNALKNVAHNGHLVYIAGPPGSMKSTVLRYIAASGSPDCMPFGFKLNLEGTKIVWFDGEQPKDIVVDSINHIKELASCGNSSVNVLDYLDMYPMNEILPDGSGNGFVETVAFARRKEMWRIFREEIIPRREHSVMIVDGLANFCDIMNWQEVELVMNQFMTVANRYHMLVFVLSHLTRDGEKLFGSGGTRLNQLASSGLKMGIYGQFFRMGSDKLRYGAIAPKVFTWGKEKNELIEQLYWPY